MDPVDWAAWLYGKMGHAGFFAVSAIVLLIIGGIWVRGFERHQEEQEEKTSKKTAESSMDRDNTAGATQQEQPQLEWWFDRKDKPTAFLGLSSSLGEEPYIYLLQFYGKNNTNERLTGLSGYVQSRSSDRRLPIGINVGGTIHEFNATEGIPPYGEFILMTWPLPSNTPSRTGGLTVSRFLIEFAEFTFVFNYNGKQFSRTFTNQEILAPIQEFTRTLAEQASRRRPSVTLKPDPPPASTAKPPLSPGPSNQSAELPVEMKWGGSMKFKAINDSPDMIAGLKCILVDARVRQSPHWVQTKDTHSSGKFKSELETGKVDLYPKPSEWLGALANENFRVAVEGNIVGGGGLGHCRITIAGTWRLEFRLEDAKGRTAKRHLCFRWSGEGHAAEALNCADIDPLPPVLHTESAGRHG